MSEMRRARESELEPALIAAILPLGPMYAEIQLHNAGLGPALEVQAKISVQPPNNALERNWRYSVLVRDKPIRFLMPDQKVSGQLSTIHELVKQYDEILIDISWKNVFDRPNKRQFRYKLQSLIDGWYKAGQLRPPEEMPEKIEELVKVVKELKDEVKGIKAVMGRRTYTRATLDESFGGEHRGCEPSSTP